MDKVDKMDKVHIKRHDTTVFFATSKMMPAMVIKKNAVPQYLAQYFEPTEPLRM